MQSTQLEKGCWTYLFKLWPMVPCKNGVEGGWHRPDRWSLDFFKHFNRIVSGRMSVLQLLEWGRFLVPWVHWKFWNTEAQVNQKWQVASNSAGGRVWFQCEQGWPADIKQEIYFSRLTETVLKNIPWFQLFLPTFATEKERADLGEIWPFSGTSGSFPGKSFFGKAVLQCRLWFIVGWWENVIHIGSSCSTREQKSKSVWSEINTHFATQQSSTRSGFIKQRNTRKGRP